MKSRFLYFLVFILTQSLQSSGQQTSECGTFISQTHIDYINQTRALRQSFDIGNQRSIVTTFPIQHHVVRKSNGTGGLNSIQLTSILANLNLYFQNANIQFYECGPVRYIDSDDYYDFSVIEENAIGQSNDIEKVINIYYFNSVVDDDGDALCGYTRLPPSTIDRVIMKNECATNGSTMVHEMGHYFSLYHTHGKAPGCSPTDEYVTRGPGANCTDHGDDLCDTPADPCLSSLVNNSCVYTGTATDANNQSYTPQTNNIMSYSKASCRNYLTAGQYNMIAASASMDRSYLSCPCTYADNYEPNNTTSAANQTAFYSPLLQENPVGPTTIQATLCDEDLDFYQMRANHKGIIQVDLVNPSGKNYDMEMYTRGPFALQWSRQTTNISIDGNSMLVYRKEPSFNFTRNYAVKVFGATASDFGPSPYSLTMSWLPSCESNNNRLLAAVSIDQGDQIFHCSQSTVLSASGGFSGYSYHWFSNEPFSCLNGDCSSISISPQSSSVYTVISPGGSCCSIDSIYVTVGTRPIANAGSNVTLQLGASTQLQGSGGGTYKWSPAGSLNNSNIYNPIASPMVTTTYVLTVTNSSGCTDTDDVTVTVQVGGGGTTPPNDNPCSATTLSVGLGCTLTTGTNVGATNSSVGTPSMCSSSSSTGNNSGDYQGGDIWYQVTIPSSGKLVINTQKQSSVSDLAMGIYTGSCGSLTQIACNDDQIPGLGSGSNWMPYIYLSSQSYPISAGQTIYVRLWEFGNNVFGTFGICAQDPGGTTSNDPDLRITINSINTTSPDPGDDVTVSMTVTNHGTVNVTNSFTARLALSSDAYLNYNDDDYISGTSRSISSLNSGASVTFSETGAISVNTSSGDYYIIAEVDVQNDQVDESNENNNTAVRAIEVGSAPAVAPDLDIDGPLVTPETNLAPGMFIRVECEVENNGNATAASGRLGYFFSEDSDYDPGIDIYLADDPLGTLDPGDNTDEWANVKIPNVTRTGTFYIIFVADYQNAFNDPDRGDNVSDYEITISTTTPALPDYVGNIFDLWLDNVSVDPDSLIPYTFLNVRLEVANIGNLDGTEDFRTKVVISNDVFIDENDFLIGYSNDNGGVDVGEPDTSSPDHLLDGIDIGPKYLIAEVDFENTEVESNEGNNKVIHPIKIIPGPYLLPDIAIYLTSVNPYSFALGDSITVEGYIVNEGAGPIDRAFNLDFYVSEDDFFNRNGDLDIDGFFSVPPVVGPGDTVFFVRRFFVQNVSQPSQYYLLVVADDNRDVAEIAKLNNVASLPIEINDVSCYYNLEASYDTIIYKDSLYSIRVHTDEFCQFWAVETCPWFNAFPTSQNPRTGCCDILFTVSRNTSPQLRVDTISIQSNMFTVFQEGCPIKSVELGNDTTVCGLVTLTIPPDSTHEAFLWSTGETSNSILISSTGAYSVTVTNSKGCITSDTIQLTTSSNSTPPISIIASQNPLCQGNPSVLNVSGGLLGAGYQWKWYSNSCGGTLEGIGNQIVVSPTSSTDYFVRAEGCDTTACVSIAINLLPPPPIDAGPNDTISVGSSAMLTASGGINYLWITGDTTASISVSPSDTTTYYVLITDLNGCQAIDSSMVIVVDCNDGISCTVDTYSNGCVHTPQPSLPTITINGPSMGVCPNSSKSYSVINESGMTYNWTAPAGAHINLGQSTSSVTVTFDSTFKRGNLKVFISNYCGASGVISLPIQSVPGQPGIINGPRYDNCNVISTYTIDSVTGATSYRWAVTIPSLPGVNPSIINYGTSARIKFPLFDQAIISVYARNVCGNSTVRTIIVYGTLPPPSPILGEKNPCRDSIETYSITPVQGALWYRWLKPHNDYTIESGDSTESIKLRIGQLKGNLQVKAVNACGEGTLRTIKISPMICSAKTEVENHLEDINANPTENLMMEISPNPSNEKINIVIVSHKRRSGELQILDVSGKRVDSKSLELMKGENKAFLRTDHLHDGMYFLRYKDQEGSKVIRFIVQH